MSFLLRLSPARKNCWQAPWMMSIYMFFFLHHWQSRDQPKTLLTWQIWRHWKTSGDHFHPPCSGESATMNHCNTYSSKTLSHAALLLLEVGTCFFKRKQTTPCWMSDCHNHSREVISPLLICVIVSITYQEELLSHPQLPCQQESIFCRHVTLKGGRGIWAKLQLEIMLVCEVKLSSTLSLVHSDSDYHTAGLFLQATVKMLQQMDVTVWSGKHFRLQNNECNVQRTMMVA